jgi:methyltransferase-like protein/cyclopropane fatty-acyl-phospholipid synthase-like methyltransferase
VSDTAPWTPVPPPANSYDEVPYESHPYAQTHPSRLFTVAALFGLSPPPVATARVLELGCASGGNLIPIAEAFPDATLVGVDQSARQVADGQRLIDRLGLANVSLRHASILDVGDSYGRYDYVICHGVFSWVPTTVRDKILDVCAKHLSPSGVAYVSYNTYPGWHMRGMIRDMMRYHANRFATPQERTRQARALLDFLATSVRPGTPYATMLKQELDALRHHADHYLYHEHLEEVNDPLYFHQFVEMARAHGLRYLGESRIGTMIAGNLAPDVEKALRILAPDQTQTEQYMDFIRNRMFRETLLVHAGNAPNWAIHPDSLRRLHVASGSRPVSDKPVDVRSEEPVPFRSPGGQSLATNRPLLKAAMRALSEAWPGTLPFDELRRRSRELLGGPADDPRQAAADARELSSGLLSSYTGSDLIELHGAAVVVCKEPGERPVAIASARARAGERRSVANRRHESVRPPDLERHLLPLLDGTRDRAALAEEMTRLAVGGGINVQRDGRAVTDPAEVRAALGAILDQALRSLARQALLTA